MVGNWPTGLDLRRTACAGYINLGPRERGEEIAGYVGKDLPRFPPIS
jgi:hypothetical protein